MEERFKELKRTIYVICLALVAIADTECCTYGFDNEIAMAENFIKKYEKENENETKGNFYKSNGF